MSKISMLPFNTALMEAIKDMVFMVSVEDDAVFKYVFFNRAVFERTPLIQEDLGKSFYETHNPETAVFLN